MAEIAIIGFAFGMVNVAIDLGKLIHRFTRSTKSNAKQCELLSDLVNQISGYIESEFKFEVRQFQQPIPQMIDITRNSSGKSIEGQVRQLENDIREIEEAFQTQPQDGSPQAAFVQKFEDYGIVPLLTLFRDVYLQCEAYATKNSIQKSLDKDKDKSRFKDLWDRLGVQLGVLSLAQVHTQTEWLEAQFEDLDTVLASILKAVLDQTAQSARDTEQIVGLTEQIVGLVNHLAEQISTSETHNLNLTHHLVFVMKDPTQRVEKSTEILSINGFGRLVTAKVDESDNGMVECMVECRQLQQKPGEFANFVKECTLMHDMDHENVLKFFGTYQPPKTTDYVDMVYGRCKTNVMVALSGNTLTTNDKLCIGLGVANGMQYLHGRTSQVIHKALTLENVLLTELRPDEGYTATMVKIAKFAQAESFGNISQANVVDKKGLKVAYMAPEFFIQRRTRTFKIDVYAFGVFLNMMFGGLPFDCPQHLKFANDLAKITYDEGDPNDTGYITIKSGDKDNTDGKNFEFPIVVKNVRVQPKLNEIVENCLDRNPDHRNAFDTIALLLNPIIVEAFKDC